jgi:hypothetical protein
MDYGGIDLPKKESPICLLTEAREVMERRIRTEPQRFVLTTTSPELSPARMATPPSP